MVAARRSGGGQTSESGSDASGGKKSLKEQIKAQQEESKGWRDWLSMKYQQYQIT
eukprot:CAMPEP_0184319404 /NCGR_PEP_ID=MMETSP1049-20130417/108314_1 /TAXON_ID=77928 /ORGANISM="Proteomonas sulcata, Strain CCMP704" /LENGTH=54 /DNA_ID=CAMNT_0026639531 /DNA_START=51 /DNA_END=212 /DNA_ORIENTATION=-